jgi:hypothetical protein
MARFEARFKKIPFERLETAATGFAMGRRSKTALLGLNSHPFVHF